MQLFSFSGPQKREAVQLQHLQHPVPPQKLARPTPLPTFRRATFPLPKLRVILHLDPSTSRTHQETSPDLAGGTIDRHRKQLPQPDDIFDVNIVIVGSLLSSDRSCSGKTCSDNLGTPTSATTNDVTDSSQRNDLPDEPVSSDLPATRLDLRKSVSH